MNTAYHVMRNGRKVIVPDPYDLMLAYDGRIVLDHYRGLLQLGEEPQPPLAIGWTQNRLLTHLMKRPGWPVYPADMVRESARQPMRAAGLRVACHRLNRIFTEHGYPKLILPASYAAASVVSDGSRGRFIDASHHELYLILGPVKDKKSDTLP